MVCAQVDNAGIDILLVGDSVAMVVHGHDTTLPVTLDEMLMHCKAVSRGSRRCAASSSYFLLLMPSKRSCSTQRPPNLHINVKKIAVAQGCMPRASYLPNPGSSGLKRAAVMCNLLWMSRAFLVGDLPFGSYETSAEQAVRSAVRMMKEGLMDAVKLEGAPVNLLVPCLPSSKGRDNLI